MHDLFTFRDPHFAQLLAALAALAGFLLLFAFAARLLRHRYDIERQIRRIRRCLKSCDQDLWHQKTLLACFGERAASRRDIADLERLHDELQRCLRQLLERRRAGIASVRQERSA